MSLMGNHSPLMNVAHGSGSGVLTNAHIGNAITATQAQIAKQYGPQGRRSEYGEMLFRGIVEVHSVANGYIVRIATHEGERYETYVASTVEEVNARIASAIVAFQLEGK
jgi:hypothetical protein